MIFTETKLKGAFVIEPERQEDSRGFFARTWCQKEFKVHGFNQCVVQCNISLSRKKGTVRGMHYQAKPFEEEKLVRCTKGTIYDVIIDLRPESQTFTQYVGVILTATNHKMIYVPKGFAHGFQAMEDNTEVFYQITCEYMPEYVRGVRWNDPAFAIEWPIKKPIILARDGSYPDFKL
jgi:dTDP-4-dehydrorhamnose 3,5-epimerase